MVKVAVPWIFFFISVIFTALHYKNIFPNNNLSWITWFLSLLFYFISFEPTKTKSFWSKKTTHLILFTAFIYFLSHLWNYDVAPWNNFGLFDDAAWDIYFAKNHVFNHTPYQAAFFDPIGVISRETFFHYYVSVAFKLFGYNLAIFNASLIFLGFFTVLFTTLLAEEFFSNTIISILVMLITNFLPIIFLNVFVGHRYAIALPLMMASYYFLYSGFRLASKRKIFFAGLFAGFCFESSVMGKQYLLALFGAAVLWLIANRGRPIKPEKRHLAWIFIFSLIMSSEPLLIYIFYAGSKYSIRESGLIQIFIDNFKTQGIVGISPNFHAFRDVFSSSFTYTRRFLPDFLAIPLAYYPLLIFGSVISVIKKRYEIILISLIILVGSFVAGCGDYRVLLAAGVWVLAIGFALDETYKVLVQKGKLHRRFMAALLFFSFLIGLVPSINYLFKISKDTNRIFYFPHKDVALSRLVQDVVAGSPNPSIVMKQNEFDRHAVQPTRATDFLYCPETAFAVIHLFLQNFNDDKILSFCERFPYSLYSSEELIRRNLNSIKNYSATDKDLQLIWEVSEKAQPALEIFRPYSKYGHSETLLGEISGIKFKLYSLIIKNENIAKFQKDLARKDKLARVVKKVSI